MRRVVLGALGVLLVWGSLGALGYVGGWQLHAARATRTLVPAERALSMDGPAPRPGAGPPLGVGGHPGSQIGCVETPSRGGQVAGLLEIPAIGLVAPVEEGTTDAVLNVAVGHDPSSVWPGAAGTSAFLAHDVSYFVHLGALRPGDVVDYRTACTTVRFVVSRAEVVTQGTPVPVTGSPTLVLDTCYPPDALFFTTKRLLVWAVERARVPNVRDAGGPPGYPEADGASYSVPAPAALVAQGLTLETNAAPMGTLTISGRTSRGWAQSPGPLALETAALEAYFGGLHAAAAGQRTWWDAIAVPGLTPPVPLDGSVVGSQDAPLDVDIVASGGTPVAVVLTTAVTLVHGADRSTYAESVRAVVHGAQVLLGGWTLQPAP